MNESETPPSSCRDDAEISFPSQEEILRTSTKLEELGKLFGESEIRWHLDGGLGISLLIDPTVKSLIRHHVDIDVSLEESELEKASQALNSSENNKYGFFLEKTDTVGEKIYEPVSVQEFAKADLGQTVIRSITSEGKIDEYNRELNFIDVHIIKRNEKGDIIAFDGVELPKEWEELSEVEINGGTVKIPHPALIAYYKLHNMGKKDDYDLQKLAETGKVTEEDLGQLNLTINSSVDVRKEKIDKILDKTVEEITNVDQNLLEEEKIVSIGNILKNQPFTANMSLEQKKFLDSLASDFVKMGSDSSGIKSTFYQAFGVENRLAQAQRQFNVFAQNCRKAIGELSVSENREAIEFFNKNYNAKGLRVMDYPVLSKDPEAESIFYENVIEKVKNFDPKNTIILFDYDGTQVSNNKKYGEPGHYVRDGFNGLFRYCKEKGFSLGTFSMREHSEINQLGNHLMDFAIGGDDITNFLETTPISKEQADQLEEYRGKEKEGRTQELLEEISKTFEDFKNTQDVTDKLVAACYFVTEWEEKKGGDRNPSKLLYLVKLKAKFPDLNVVLVDDNQNVIKMGQSLGLVVQAPQSEGFEPDHN